MFNACYADTEWPFLESMLNTSGFLELTTQSIVHLANVRWSFIHSQLAESLNQRRVVASVNAVANGSTSFLNVHQPHNQARLGDQRHHRLKDARTYVSTYNRWLIACRSCCPLSRQVWNTTRLISHFLASVRCRRLNSWTRSFIQPTELRFIDQIELRFIAVR